MRWLALGLPLVGLAVSGCKDSVTGFLSCGVAVCSARQECVETAAGPSCVCAEGFEGPGCSTCSSGYKKVNANRCDLIPIDCDANPAVCGLHGSCLDKSGGDTCECDELYAGRLCELCQSGYQDNDSDGICRATCAEAALDCQAPSRCSDAGGTAVCDCPAGYTGDDCSRCALGYRDNGTACVATCDVSVVDCQGHQVCVDSPMGARCECAAGYAGSSCQSCAQGYREDPSTGTCLPSCDATDEMCGEHGHCDDSVGFARCVCDFAHVGDDCQECAAEFEMTASGECERALSGAETLVMQASYQSRAVLATLDMASGAALPLAEVASTGLCSGSQAQSLFFNQAGSISELTLPAASPEVVVPSSGAVGPLAYDPAQGRLYGLTGKAPYRLLSIDPVSQVVVELLDTNLAGVADLAFDAAENRVLALRDTLYAVSLTDGAVSQLGALPPATVGIEVGADGALLALAATDADEASSRVQACRATASRLGLLGYTSATGRFIQPAAVVDSVSVEAATTDDREVLSYLGRGGSAGPRTLEVAVQNPAAFVCLALEEATLVRVTADASFRILVIYAADADVELTFEADAMVGARPNIYLGGYAPSFTYLERDDVVEHTPQEWLALKLPIDARFHQPGPGVLHTLDSALVLQSSTTLSAAVVPAGALSAWTPVLP